MTTPALPPDPDSADTFLATTSQDEHGEVTTEYIALQDVSLETLWHYTTLGDERAAAELASRLVTDAEPAPEEAS